MVWLNGQMMVPVSEMQKDEEGKGNGERSWR